MPQRPDGRPGEQNVHEALSVADRFHVVERVQIVFSGEPSTNLNARGCWN